MVAVLAALAGARAHVLGTEVPISDIASAAREARASAVGLSVSLATGGVRTDRSLGELRALLPPEVGLIVRGAGARGGRRGPRGVQYARDLAAAEAWLGTLAAGR